jgi:hypothetical protein
MPRERARAIDWEHLLFVAFMLTFVAWYLSTAAASSPTFSNLILIAPIGAVASALLLYAGFAEYVGRNEKETTVAPSEQTKAPAGAAHGRFRSGSLGAILALMGLFGLFVVAMPYAGFDVACFLFVGSALWLLGERRVLFLLFLSLGIAVTLSIAALTLLTFPIPLGIARLLWSAL